MSLQGCMQFYNISVSPDYFRHIRQRLCSSVGQSRFSLEDPLKRTPCPDILPMARKPSPCLVAGKRESRPRDAQRGLIRVCVLIYARALVHCPPPHVSALVAELEDTLQVEQAVRVFVKGLDLHQEHLLSLRSMTVAAQLL